MENDFDKTLSVLSLIGKLFNKHQIVWAIGGSILLHHYQLADRVGDIDIFIRKEDFFKAEAILLTLGEKKPLTKNDTYLTEYFSEFKVKQIDIDLMANFKIRHSMGIYTHMFNPSSIKNFFTIDDIHIPLMLLEDWYIIYQLIPNRDERVLSIERYFEINGIQHISVLDQVLTMSLPADIIFRISKMINKATKGIT